MPDSRATQASTSTSRRVSLPRPLPSPSPLATEAPSMQTRSHSDVLTPEAVAAQRRRSAPPTPPQAKSRARDLLRKHYGLGVGPPTPLPGATRNPMNLDSTAFDAKSYYEQLITTSSLPTLLKRENELLSEIRELDSERQALVYNHHHELIAASDTIAAMKARAESLDADLELLKIAFSEISRLGAEVAIEDDNQGNP
ncbi:hypothetical protein FISHEDRAFT_77649 [Fistulina hepatica ATCC 64428]|uniref:Vacuolar protein sorting-associated protein 51 homolog n=1 Tax=Fistulina hepatica ATCC 64428 TaxID=1128425 RepID=A0A0D7A3H5_9AGAR|nr:hypothetical protein FISHEDRAFT_77649 [Fistulina hepatica ATCC 64428]